MIFRLEGEFPRHAAAAHFDIGALVASVRHAVIQYIRQPHLQLGDLRLKGLEPLLHALQPCPQGLAYAE